MSDSEQVDSCERSSDEDESDNDDDEEEEIEEETDTWMSMFERAGNDVMGCTPRSGIFPTHTWYMIGILVDML